jgi:hypothetical protein
MKPSTGTEEEEGEETYHRSVDALNITLWYEFSYPILPDHPFFRRNYRDTDRDREWPYKTKHDNSRQRPDKTRPNQKAGQNNSKATQIAGHSRSLFLFFVSTPTQLPVKITPKILSPHEQGWPQSGHFVQYTLNKMDNKILCVIA